MSFKLLFNFFLSSFFWILIPTISCHSSAYKSRYTEGIFLEYLTSTDLRQGVGLQQRLRATEVFSYSRGILFYFIYVFYVFYFIYFIYVLFYFPLFLLVGG